MSWILLLPALAIIASWTVSNFVGTLNGYETPMGFIHVVNQAGSVSLAFNPEYREPFVLHLNSFPRDEDLNTLAGRFDFKLESLSGPLWYVSVTVPYWLLFGSYLIFIIFIYQDRVAQRFLSRR